MNLICVFLGAIFIIIGIEFARGKEYLQLFNWTNLPS